jgi:hypothetical protein
MKPIFIILFLTLGWLGGCSKEKDNNSRESLLTSGSWKLTAAVADDDGNGSYETNAFAGFPDCFKDNYYIFQGNGDLELNEGLTKCDPGDPQTMTTTWAFTQNQSHLEIASDEYAIEELNETTLKLKLNLGGGRSNLTTFTKR